MAYLNTFKLILITFLKMLLKRGIYTSYSQRGEDIIAMAQLRGMRGIYVDVGAYHPMLYSNTYALYRSGWHGLVIDPNITLRPLYSLFRHRDIFVPCGIGKKEMQTTYYKFEDGAYNTLDFDTAKALQTSPQTSKYATHDVQIKPLNVVLRENNITHIDLLNIDTEGFDYIVLISHNWSIRPKVIIIEDHDFNPDKPYKSIIYTFLNNKQYKLTGLSGETLIFHTTS